MKNNITLSIDKFGKTNTSLPKIIVIYGPTACGKTALSLEAAKHL